MPSEEKEKPSPKRGSKIITNSRTKNTPESPLKPDKEGSPSPPTPNTAKKSGDDQKAPNIVPLNNTTKISPPNRITVTTIGSSWDSLPSDVQSLGLVNTPSIKILYSHR